MTSLRTIATLLVMSLAGCGDPRAFDSTRPASAPAAEALARAEFVKGRAPMREAGRDSKQVASPVEAAAGAVLVPAQPPGTPAQVSSPAIVRKIIYDSQVDLIVESVDPVAKKVTASVQEARGFIAEMSVAGSPGSLRSMRWRIRVPVEQFDSFVDSILSLGELERNNRTSQDVTEQYYDIEARIKNKKVEEQTLNKILQERSGKLEDVLKIEVELSRVRGEIEQLEGKIRLLENLSSLATLTLNVREREKYAPPPPVVANFSTQIARVWDSSILGLVNVGKAIVLWAVSWAVWVPILLVGAIVAWILVRWMIRSFVRNLPRMIALARTPITPPRTPAP